MQVLRRKNTEVAFDTSTFFEVLFQRIIIAKRRQAYHKTHPLSEDILQQGDFRVEQQAEAM